MCGVEMNCRGQGKTDEWHLLKAGTHWGLQVGQVKGDKNDMFSEAKTKQKGPQLIASQSRRKLNLE